MSKHVICFVFLMKQGAGKRRRKERILSLSHQQEPQLQSKGEEGVTEGEWEED